jgi:hypothetical protein
MRTRLYFLILSLGFFISTACVEDNMFVSNTGNSDVVLVINEVMSNMGDPNPDWIEIYNPGNAVVDMAGFGVYDNPSAKYTFATGTTIAAKGYLVIVCDKALATSDPAQYANFGISSGGEAVYLVDASDAVIDQVEVPAMSLGISYARIPDGGVAFANANPTKGAANSNTNEAPVIEADTLVTGSINDNQRYVYDIVVKDASGIASVKIWLQTSEETIFADMAPMGGGEYRYVFPLLPTGSISYYIEAVDETGLKSHLKTDAGNPFTLNVVDGLAVFNSVTLSNNNPGDMEDVLVTVNVYDRSGISGVRLYYLINNEDAANKLQLDMVYANGVWTATIPGQTNNTVVRYYIRAIDNSALKSYYPIEDGLGEFNHDAGSTWPQIVFAPLNILNKLVINEINASGSPYDYIELYNSTSAAIDISGYKVYDSGGTAVAYTIPASTTIAAGGFYLIQTGSGSPQGQFGISGSGETITLENALGIMVDQVLQVNWPGTPLIIRKKDGAELWVVTTTATPGATNN